MELNEKQKIGLELAVKRYYEGESYTVIAGYAGAGKSTLVSFIVNALKLNQHDVCYIAYTGKASLVLRDKGCPNAMTAHKLLYQSYPRKDGTFFHKIKRPIDPYKLIVVDEVSMLPKEMWDLLLSHRIHVIALGDPGQLPPVMGDNNILDNPHIFLDEIMRQAQESEIIKLSMDIRAGKPLVPFKGKEVQVIDKKDVVDGMFLWADCIICGKNETRHIINTLVRKQKYGEDVSKTPIVGDKVICLRNDWDTITEDGTVLVNGTTGIVTDIVQTPGNRWVSPGLIADILPDGGDFEFMNLSLDHKLLTTGEPTVNKDNFRKIPPFAKPKEFDFGYCVTCWKAQGGEYDKVLVFEENFPFDKEEHQRFLYTAVTRAKKRLVVVRK